MHLERRFGVGRHHFRLGRHRYMRREARKMGRERVEERVPSAAPTRAKGALCLLLFVLIVEVMHDVEWDVDPRGELNAPPAVNFIKPA